MAGELLLVVESPDDKHVFLGILSRNHFLPEFDIRVEDGIETLLKRVPVHLKTQVERLGIVVDADSDIRARWLEIKGILSRAGYESLPDDPDPTGTVIDRENMPRVGVWIMPDNTTHGMLEDFLCFLVPAGDALFERARRCVEGIPLEERRFAQTHLTKALVHTWRAWQKKPGTPLGQAVGCRRYLDTEGEHVRKLLDWLTRLFA